MSLEEMILGQLAPITAHDQQEMRSILAHNKGSDEEVELIFQLMEKKGANYIFFFTEASDPLWIPILQERGYFSNPPSVEDISEVGQHTPYWWPLRYLS